MDRAMTDKEALGAKSDIPWPPNVERSWLRASRNSRNCETFKARNKNNDSEELLHIPLKSPLITDQDRFFFYSEATGKKGNWNITRDVSKGSPNENLAWHAKKSRKWAHEAMRDEINNFWSIDFFFFLRPLARIWGQGILKIGRRKLVFELIFQLAIN